MGFSSGGPLVSTFAHQGFVVINSVVGGQADGNALVPDPGVNVHG